MSSWRDDLPPIPSERILDDAVREGRRRQDQRRQQRRQMFTIAGVGLAAAVVVGIVTASLVTDRGENGDQAAEVTVSPADTAAVGPTTEAGVEETTAETVLPQGTEAAEATTGPTEASSDATQSGAASETTTPVSDEVFVGPTEVWELGPTGPVCGPTDVAVTYAPLETAVASATVRWNVAGSFGESPMTISDNVATATIGPFPPETLAGGAAEELQVVVIAVEPSGATRRLRPPAGVVVRDCAG